MSSRYPRLIAFDLDYTLWDLWIDTHVSGPLRRHKNTINQVLDRYGEVVAFYKDVPAILHHLRAAGVTIAACSRTEAPDLACQALRLLLTSSPAASEDALNTVTPAIGFFDELEIYPGSKLTHFKNLHKKTGIPYSEMLFFDDEHRNKEVEQLGVTFYLVSSGLTHRTFEKGLARWIARNPLIPPQTELE